MKNIIIYIILDINPKYIELMMVIIIYLFYLKKIALSKKGDISTKQFGWWDEFNEYIIFYFIIYIYKLIHFIVW